MSFGKQVPLRIAQPIANRLVERLSPSCQRIEVAGSIRRGRPTVGDMEILCVPLATTNADMFGVPYGTLSQLDEAIEKLMASSSWSWDRHQPRQGQKWKRLLYEPHDLVCDLFVTTLRAWATTLMVRTGPGPFSQHLMSTALRMGYHFADGFLLHAHPGPCQDGPECARIIEAPTEESVFEALKLPWRGPRDREGFRMGRR